MAVELVLEHIGPVGVVVGLVLERTELVALELALVLAHIGPVDVVVELEHIGLVEQVLV